MRRRRRSKFVPAPEPDAKLKGQLAKYAWKAKENMDRFDRLSPYQRALVNFFGADVLARLPSGLEERQIAKRLGKAKEFEEYWTEFSKPVQAKKEAEAARVASAWDGIL